ncbi:hypothetical protein D3C79_979380 [compost metagenome]
MDVDITEAIHGCALDVHGGVNHVTAFTGFVGLVTNITLRVGCISPENDGSGMVAIFDKTGVMAS